MAGVGNLNATRIVIVVIRAGVVIVIVIVIVIGRVATQYRNTGIEDPRWGAVNPVASTSVALSSGLQRIVVASRTVVLNSYPNGATIAGHETRLKRRATCARASSTRRGALQRFTRPRGTSTRLAYDALGVVSSTTDLGAPAPSRAIDVAGFAHMSQLSAAYSNPSEETAIPNGKPSNCSNATIFNYF